MTVSRCKGRHPQRALLSPPSHVYLFPTIKISIASPSVHQTSTSSNILILYRQNGMYLEHIESPSLKHDHAGWRSIYALNGRIAYTVRRRCLLVVSAVFLVGTCSIELLTAVYYSIQTFSPLMPLINRMLAPPVVESLQCSVIPLQRPC